jgi:hypothetical protein
MLFLGALRLRQQEKRNNQRRQNLLQFTVEIKSSFLHPLSIFLLTFILASRPHCLDWQFCFDGIFFAGTIAINGMQPRHNWGKFTAYNL